MMFLTIVLVTALIPIVSSWIVVRNDSDGSVLWTSTAPNYVLANPSFNVTARLFVVPDGDHATYSVPTEASGRIVLVNYGLGGSMYRWGQSCTRVGCAGVVSHHGLSQGNDYQMAVTYWVHSKPFTTAPIVVIALSLSDRFMDLATSSSALQATITSGDYNEVDTIVHSPYLIGVSAIGSVVSVVNVVVGMYKFVQMSLDKNGRLRPIPVLPGFAIGFEILASLIRGVYLTDVALYRGQGTSYDVQQYLLSSSIPFSFACTTLVAVAMFECYHWDKQVRRSQRVKLTMLAMSAFVFLIFDQVVTVLSAVNEHEVLSSAAGVGAFYFVVHIPIVVGFIVYGGRVAKAMTTSIKKLDPESISRTRRFARRTAISGVVGACALVVEVLFIITSQVSIWGVLVGWMAMLATNSATGFFHIVAFKSKPSCISIRLFSRTSTAKVQDTPVVNVVPQHMGTGAPPNVAT